MAAVLVVSLRDPAAALLAAVPISRLQRRALRLALVGPVAGSPVWLLVASTSCPATGWPLGPLLALAASGVAVATWLPVDRDTSVAAAVPLLWASAAALFGGSVGPGERRTDLVADRPVVGHRRGRDCWSCSGRHR